MNTDDEWVVIDTETDGMYQPIHAVEIAAQRMRGWTMVGAPFRVLLNHRVPIDPWAESIHGYSEAYLAQHGLPPEKAHAAFRAYVGDLPLVAHNVSFDWDRVLLPEYRRLGVPTAGRRGFCALTLARRVTRETRNHKLDTLKAHFGIQSGRSHQAVHDVQTLALLFQEVYGPRLQLAGIMGFSRVELFSRQSPIARCHERMAGIGD